MPTQQPPSSALNARVLEAERHVPRSGGYRTARLLLALGALAHFGLFVVVLPAARVRGRIQADAHDAQAVFVAYGLALLSVLWGCAGTVRLWLQARLWLARQFARSLVPSAPDGFDARVLGDVAGALADAPLAPSGLRRLRELREAQALIERELDERLARQPRWGMQAARKMLDVASVLAVGLSFFAGCLGMMGLCSAIPERLLVGVGAELRLGLGGALWLTAGVALGYAAFHAMMRLRCAVSRRMLAVLGGALARSGSRV